MRLYLSASIANTPLNQHLKRVLERDDIELVLPEEFVPVERAHASYPRAIFQACIDEMERCDAGVLLLDAFGIDCAAEAGWFHARDKPIIGLVASNARFLQHWMVKGSLSGVICLEPVLLPQIRADPILGERPVQAIDDWASVGRALRDILPTTSGRTE